MKWRGSYLKGVSPLIEIHCSCCRPGASTRMRPGATSCARVKNGRWPYQCACIICVGSSHLASVSIWLRSPEVYSDTLGCIATRDGRSILTKPTLKWPFFMQYLCRWAGAASTEPFRFSSISLNCNYGAVRHRDSNNIGPSLTR